MDLFVQGNEIFSLRLYYELRKNPTSNLSANLVFSPFSASAVLTMLAEGADANTLMQLRKGLGISGLARRGYKALLPALISNTTNSVVEKKSLGFK